MASENNITMKQYNGTDYDTLYPKNTSQQSLLNDSTLATALGLSGTPTVNDALTAITLVAGGAKIETGSYVGTGTYGSSNPCSLTFDFAPKVLFMLGVASTTISSGGLTYTALLSGITSTTSDTQNFAINCSILPNYPTFNAYFGFSYASLLSHSYAFKSEDGKTIYWYHRTDALNQLNNTSTSYTYNYYYLAIG